MLVSLEIHNYALIQHTKVEFQPGLNIITGETGAGKSIMLGALGLALGNRAELSQMANPEAKCWIEATFDIGELNLKEYFNENDLEFNPLTILRREILPGGRSRMFINDSPVNLIQVKELSMLLLDIHNQHENLLLKSCGFLIEVIDVLADTLPERSSFQNEYKRFKRLESDEREAGEVLKKAKSEQDFLAFQIEEWNALNWERGMQEELERLQERQENADRLMLWKREAEDLAEQENTGILDRLRQLQIRISKIEKYVQTLGWNERLHAIYVDIQDIMSEMAKELQGLEESTGEIPELTERLDAFYTLLRKHRASDETELLSVISVMKDSLEGIEAREQEWQSLSLELNESKTRLHELGMKLRMKRKDALDTVVDELIPHIKDLGMKHATISLELTEREVPGPDGMDELKFLFSANPGMPADEVSKVASGGEISRIMLLLKQGIARKRSYPTLLFDEIDTGVSGAVADKMGEKLKDTSKSMQLIVITHLPQIAAKGDAHFVVKKYSDDKSTSTTMHKCSPEERVKEIAAMLSGAELSISAIENAKNLLGLK
jgi:DNA repair protein RecN (Recombination protein N)